MQGAQPRPSAMPSSGAPTRPMLPLICAVSCDPLCEAEQTEEHQSECDHDDAEDTRDEVAVLQVELAHGTAGHSAEHDHRDEHEREAGDEQQHPADQSAP